MNRDGQHRAPLVPRRAVDAGEALGANLQWHPWQRVTACLAAGYALVTGLLIGLGLLITGVLAHGPIGAWDDNATAWLAEHRVAWLDGVTDVLSRSGDTLGALLLATVVMVALFIHRWRWEIVFLVSALALELATFLLVNFVVDRPRPSVERMGSTPSTASFPSGHSAASLVIWASIAIFVTAATQRLLPRLVSGGAAVIVPCSVGFARVYRGMHRPLDVAAGLLMGALVLTVAVLAVSAGRGREEMVELLEPSESPEIEPTREVA